MIVKALSFEEEYWATGFRVVASQQIHDGHLIWIKEKGKTHGLYTL